MISFLKSFLPRRLRTWLRKRRSRFYGQDMEMVFKQIHQTDYWNKGEAGTSVSGPGSELVRNKDLIESLPLLFKRLGIRSILDLGCGDFGWMKEVNLGDIIYTGADIVEAIVIQNQASYESENRRFIHLNFIQQPLPDADLILCRDCLVHFSNPDILQALDRIRNSNSHYLLATHFDEITSNDDITTGNWRPLNLQITPFFLPPPNEVLPENVAETAAGKKLLALWEL